MDRDTLITKLTQIAFSSYEYSEVAREAIFLIQKYEKEIDTLCQERCSEDSGAATKLSHAEIDERLSLCVECDSELCRFNPDGYCLCPLITGTKPKITEDGCLDYEPKNN